MEFFALGMLVSGQEGDDSEKLADGKEDFVLGELEGVDIAIVVNF